MNDTEIKAMIDGALEDLLGLTVSGPTVMVIGRAMTRLAGASKALAEREAEDVSETSVPAEHD